MKTRNMISFDWAMKRLLRNKANFEVLEGCGNNHALVLTNMLTRCVYLQIK